MDVSSASASISKFKQSALGEQVGIMILKKSQDLAVQQGQQLTQMLEQSVQPHLGQNINFRV